MKGSLTLLYHPQIIRLLLDYRLEILYVGLKNLHLILVEGCGTLDILHLLVRRMPLAPAVDYGKLAFST